MTALLSIPIASYWSIKRLALKYFYFVQQDQKLIGIGINVIPEMSYGNQTAGSSIRYLEDDDKL
ncbi:hypothetical protein CXF85_19285 [Colwellia sp. 75C3]|nr:hypothetical protein CXF85_19285 [Colwellia sp. 75C3]